MGRSVASRIRPFSWRGTCSAPDAMGSASTQSGSRQEVPTMRTVAVRRCRILSARVNAYAGDRREVAPRGSRAPHRLQERASTAQAPLAPQTRQAERREARDSHSEAATAWSRAIKQACLGRLRPSSQGPCAQRGERGVGATNGAGSRLVSRGVLDTKPQATVVTCQQSRRLT
jgi:hypothetical protein